MRVEAAEVQTKEREERRSLLRVVIECDKVDTAVVIEHCDNTHLLGVRRGSSMSLHGDERGGRALEAERRDEGREVEACVHLRRVEYEGATCQAGVT